MDHGAEDYPRARARYLARRCCVVTFASAGAPEGLAWLAKNWREVGHRA